MPLDHRPRRTSRRRCRRRSTTASSRTASTVAARMRGITSRWIGLMPMTSMADDLVADATGAEVGAHGRPTGAGDEQGGGDRGLLPHDGQHQRRAEVGLGARAGVMSAPTCSEMTMPNGIEMRITGIVVTLARNQSWSRNSAKGHGRLKILRTASRPTAVMFPVSRREARLPFRPGRIVVVDIRPGGTRRRAARGALLGPPDQLALDVGLLGGQLVHADGPVGPTPRGTG